MWLIGSKLAGVLTAKCRLGSGFHMTSQLYMHALCMRSLADWWMVSSSSSLASDDDYGGEPLLKKFCVLLCMPQNAPEYTSEHIKLPKLPGGTCPLTPLE